MQDTAVFSHECLVVSEELKKNTLTEIIELLRLEHMNTQERESVIVLVSNSQERFYIPGEKLTYVLQHQIPTTRPINTRQYRFLQIHKEKINKKVEELLKSIVKPSHSRCIIHLFGLYQKRRTQKDIIRIRTM